MSFEDIELNDNEVAAIEENNARNLAAPYDNNKIYDLLVATTANEKWIDLKSTGVSLTTPAILRYFNQFSSAKLIGPGNQFGSTMALTAMTGPGTLPLGVERNSTGLINTEDEQFVALCGFAWQLYVNSSLKVEAVIKRDASEDYNYGLDITSNDVAKRELSFEDQCLISVKIAPNGVATIWSQKYDGNNLVSVNNGTIACGTNTDLKIKIIFSEETGTGPGATILYNALVEIWTVQADLSDLNMLDAELVAAQNIALKTDKPYNRIVSPMVVMPKDTAALRALIWR